MPQRHPVTTLDAFPPGSKRAFKIADRRIALFNVEGRLHAMDDVCPHAGASLAAGPLRGTCITCPLHAIKFDVTTGQPVGLQGIDALQCFPVSVNGGQIEIEA
jgi:3-phenylpropionate/trans-cinnamate dioxygenase ferredoxin subunit